MSDFTPEWLSLREAVDRRSRDRKLLAWLRNRFAATGRTTICELGAGSGSLLRALAPELAQRQEWRLLDADPDNLKAADEGLRAWADEVRECGSGLALTRAGREILVHLEERDLNEELETCLEGADLVATSALFDLAGPAWLGRLARALAADRRPLYASLTYSGSLEAEPAHPLDRAVALAFGAHQRSDKGLGGVAAGPSAQALLAAALAALGAEVLEGDSSWHLGADDAALTGRVIEGHAEAVLETGLLPRDAVHDWRESHLSACRRLSVGHRDLLASWPEAA